MIRYRIRDTQHDRTVFESAFLDQIDSTWKRRYRHGRDRWIVQWKDAENASRTNSPSEPRATWATVPADELAKRRPRHLR